MAHQSGFSNVGERRVYEGGDQETYSHSDVSAAGSKSGVNTAGYMDQDQIVNKLRDQEDKRKVDERSKHEPGYLATLHGNEPSRGAKVDAELAQEDAEIIAKKKQQTDSVPGKKLESGTDKSDPLQELDAAAKAERTAHSKSGANTGQSGPEYVPEKELIGIGKLLHSIKVGFVRLRNEMLVRIHLNCDYGQTISHCPALAPASTTVTTHPEKK